MTKKPSKKEALEALDFIVSVLKEHEKDLDRLIGELDEVTKRFGETGEVSGKIEAVEERLSSLQTDMSDLIRFISSPREAPIYAHGPPVIVRCKQWEDFKVLSSGAETVSFLFRETEKTFQADALKGGRVLTYSGEFPRDTRLLRIWLARELDVAEDKVFEGVLAVG
ncbi:MAG: hypothetical protein GWN31_02745 [Candidatus Thorarchaeota archaeon]|nr:hypothetical protein [Candidatus Thorarchaeota archaeon]